MGPPWVSLGPPWEFHGGPMGPHAGPMGPHGAPWGQATQKGPSFPAKCAKTIRLLIKNKHPGILHRIQRIQRICFLAPEMGHEMQFGTSLPRAGVSG